MVCSLLTFIVILLYSYDIHVKNSHLNMTLIKRQNGNFKVQIHCCEIKSEKARVGKNLSCHHHHHCHRHQPLIFLQCLQLTKSPHIRIYLWVSCYRKNTEQRQINQIGYLLGRKLGSLMLVPYKEKSWVTFYRKYKYKWKEVLPCRTLKSHSESESISYKGEILSGCRMRKGYKGVIWDGFQWASRMLTTKWKK